jgi:hypothetical protein
MLMVIDPSGSVHCLYGEQIDLNSLGELTIHRVSFIEPDHTDWYADLSPVAGPILGPFTLRSQALQAEFDWLEQHLVTLSEKATLNPD